MKNGVRKLTAGLAAGILLIAAFAFPASAEGGAITAVSSETYTTKSYKGDGTEASPYTVLCGLSDSAFSASWKSMNWLGGYDETGKSTELTGTPKYALLEEKDATGLVKASVFIDGTKWKATKASEKSPYKISYALNLDESAISAILSTHTLFTGSYADKLQPAVSELSSYSADPNTLLFLCRANAAEFKGPLKYTLYVKDFFKPGDTLSMKYICGAGDASKMEGSSPTAETMLELDNKAKASYNQSLTVDNDGYISFEITNGGFFAFAAPAAAASETALTSQLVAPETTEVVTAAAANPSTGNDSAMVLGMLAAATLSVTILAATKAKKN